MEEGYTLKDIARVLGVSSTWIRAMENKGDRTLVGVFVKMLRGRQNQNS
jgi:transcriptional regulator with XRE-family HTH domain